MSFVFQQKGLIGMKVFAVALALAVTLAAAPSFAQAAARPAQGRPAAPAGQTQTPAPRPATPTPAAPAVQQPAPQAQAPQPRPPFPTGVKYAFVYVQQIAAASAEGKAATQKIQQLQQQKASELDQKNKTLQAAQQKLEQGGSVLNDAARQQLANDIDKQQRDIQRFTEDAQNDLQKLQQELQDEFQKKLTPIIARVAQEKQLHMIFSVTDSGLVWGDPALDLTDEVIKAFDAASGGAKK